MFIISPMNKACRCIHVKNNDKTQTPQQSPELGFITVNAYNSRMDFCLPDSVINSFLSMES